MVAQQFENRAGTRSPLDASTLFLSGRSGASAPLGVSDSVCGTKWASHNLKTASAHAPLDASNVRYRMVVTHFA